ncbi:putative Ig domain-containing protein [Spirosoma rhododendri]|uniref:T9SS type A sorting domain-containing protein n=1 Tax=Spirosoma rhododendri TaxID=2728024 RepID=A0A7L5DIN5_9BACT|nr:putative Ig domain-containing protein [Spirosoma rhododendri]QJD77251.1 T9SS type A sorting domain-containing protein [Spirosoma rhododendri]
MIEFLLLLVGQLRSYVRSLLWPTASSVYQSTQLRLWHQLLYVSIATKNRLYAIGFALLLFLPMGAHAQLISVTTPTSICAGQSTTLDVAIKLPVGTSLNALAITATAPAGLTATVNALTSNTSATISVATSPTLTTGTKLLSVTASLLGIPTLTVDVPITVTGLPVVSAITQPVAASVGSLLTLGSCPIGSALSYTVTNSGTGAVIATGGTAPLLLDASVAGQSVRIACNGTCAGQPTTLALPNIAGLSLAAPTASICVGQPLSLTLLPTGIDLTQAGITLTAATPSGALTVGALGPDGVLTVSGGNLTVGNPTSVTVTALLNNVPLASATVGVNVLAQPAAPAQPGTITTTVGSVLSLTGLCPTGTTLTTGALIGNGIISVPTLTAGTQSLTVLCSNGTCLGLPTIVNVNVVTPIISASASAAICLGQPLSLTVLPANFNLADGIVSIAVSGPVGISASAIDNNGVITITGLPAGNQNLTVTASVAGAPVASVQVPVSVNTVQPPTVVTTTGGTYPAGVSSLSVTQNTGSVLFTVSCASGTSSYTGTGGITGSGDFSVATTATGVYNYSVVCTNAPCVSAATVVSVSVVSPVNQAPVLTGTPITSPQTATVGAAFSTPTAYAFNDPDGGPLTYSASPLPAGITINPQTGVISGTASTTVGSPFTVTVTATDPQSASVSASFVLNVVNPVAPNQAPVLTGTPITSPQTATVGAAFSTPTAYAFNDPDGGPLTYSASPLPAGITINPQTGVISGTASTTVGAPFTVTVTATDPQSASVSASFVLNVVNPVAPNQAPVLTGTPITSPQTATVGAAFTTPTAYAFNDPDGGPLTYSASPLPAGITINPQTGVISGTASTTVGAPFTVTVTATDPQSASVSASFVLNVVNPVAPNQAPVLTGTPITSPQTATVGAAFSTPTAYAFNDPDGGPLTYSASPLPAGITINPQTGVIAGTASTTAGSPFTVTVTATDPQSASVSTSFVLNVVNPAVVNPGAPFSITSVTTNNCQVIFAGERQVTFTPNYAGLNGQTVTFRVVNETMPTTAAGPYTLRLYTDNPTIQLRATQAGSSNEASFSYNWLAACGNTTPTNQAPVLTGTGITSPQTATVGVGFTTPTAQAFNDPDGGPLTYSASPLPAGITINPQTGVISGTASTTVGSPFTVTVTATDPQSASVSTSFVLNVVNPAAGNQAPVLTGTGITSPQTATVGASFSTPTAQAFRDPDGGTLTYSASPLPAGITINPQTGVISGTASTTVGAPFTVIVTATDPQQASVSTSFVLNVVNPTAPTTACGSTNLDGSPLRAIMPGFNCTQLKSSGNIQFIATGGSATGGAIEFKAIGVTDWTTNCQQIIDRETRTACDAAPIEIQVRQLVNGSYIYGTSYVFDIRRECPIAGCGGLPTPNRAPVVSAGIPNQVATVGQEFKYAIPANAFVDPDGDELLYTASRLPDSFTFSSGFFGAYPTTAEVISVTVTAYDNSGGQASTSFTITVNPNPSTQPPTTPQPQTCGSTNLNGSALQATAPNVNCEQLKASGNIQFTATGGNPNGGAIEFRAIGVTDWTTNCQQIIDRETRTACDAAPIEIQVRQLVNGSYVYGTSYVFNIRQVCPIAGCGAARVSAEAKTPLDVRVLGNPTRDESISVDIQHAEGQRLHLMITDTQGFTVSEHTVESAGAVEHQTLKLGSQAGIYLLRVSTPTQLQTVKVLKQ